MKDFLRTDKNSGFTLIEMLVVIAIAGILAISVVFTMNSGASKVRGAAFRLRGDINLARAEAVNRNADVLVEFLTGVPQGYRICIDDPASTNINQCGDATDTPIKSVTFAAGVRYYNQAFAAPDGPGVEVDGVTAWGAADDGIRGFGGNNFLIYQNNGTVNSAGTVYIYYTDPNNPGNIQAGPFAVNITTIGRVKLLRWQNAAWRTR